MEDVSIGNSISKRYCLCTHRHPTIIPFVSGEEKSISCLPMVHIAGLMIGMLNPLSQGAGSVILPRFDPESYLEAIQNHRVLHHKSLSNNHSPIPDITMS